MVATRDSSRQTGSNPQYNAPCAILNSFIVYIIGSSAVLKFGTLQLRSCHASGSRGFSTSLPQRHAHPHEAAVLNVLKLVLVTLYPLL